MRGPLWKMWFTGAGAAFLLFAARVVMSPSSGGSPPDLQSVEQTNTAQEEPESDLVDKERESEEPSERKAAQPAEQPAEKGRPHRQASGEQCPAPVEFRRAYVSRVVAGDTTVVSLSGREEKVRLIGVNVPESTIRHEPYGEEASAFTKSRLARQRCPRRDSYLSKSETRKRGWQIWELICRNSNISIKVPIFSLSFGDRSSFAVLSLSLDGELSKRPPTS